MRVDLRTGRSFREERKGIVEDEGQRTGWRRAPHVSDLTVSDLVTKGVTKPISTTKDTVDTTLPPATDGEGGQEQGPNARAERGEARNCRRQAPGVRRQPPNRDNRAVRKVSFLL
jgi:hypothetical protein